MANDQQRGAELIAVADVLELEGKAELGHRIRKFVQLVVDRDAGPTDLVKAENTQLRERITRLEAEAVVLQADLQAAKAFKPEAVRLTRNNAGLKTELEAQRKKYLTLEAKNKGTDFPAA